MAQRALQSREALAQVQFLGCQHAIRGVRSRLVLLRGHTTETDGAIMRYTTTGKGAGRFQRWSLGHRYLYPEQSGSSPRAENRTILMHVVGIRFQNVVQSAAHSLLGWGVRRFVVRSTLDWLSSGCSSCTCEVLGFRRGEELR